LKFSKALMNFPKHHNPNEFFTLRVES